MGLNLVTKGNGGNSKRRAPQPKRKGPNAPLPGLKRWLRGWSYAGLAEKVGANPSYMSLVCRGQRMPSVRMMKKLASALGVEMGELAEVFGAAPPYERTA